MAYSDSFPATRPVFQADFANGGRVDPRITFSRSDTPPTYAAPSAVHYWSNEKHLSSENLLPYSNNVSSSEWTKSRVTVDSANNSSPDGGSDASLILETVDSNTHTWYDGYPCVNGESYTHTMFAKANGRTIVKMMMYSTSSVCEVEFDLSALTSTVVSGSASNHSIVDVGGSWRKLTFTAVANGTGTGYHQNFIGDGSSYSYAGDVTKGVYVWGHQVSSTGETVLNETSGSIHRSYAPTLKSVSTAGQPRFEYSPTDSASEVMGQSRGLLIEGQATNYLAGSATIGGTYWGSIGATSHLNSAVAPDGTLTATKLVENSSGGTKYFYSNNFTPATSTTYTCSVYVKPNGRNYCLLYTNIGGANQSSMFDLVTGATSNLSGSGTNQATQCGNGWWRISMTVTTSSTLTHNFQILTATDATTINYTGNGYSGLLCWGAMLEQSSFPSSYIGTTSSAVTRAADSASVVDSSLFDNGEGALFVEADQLVANTYNGIASLETDISNIVQIFGNTTNFRAEVVNGGTTVANMVASGNSPQGVARKHCLTYSPTETKYFVGGSQIGATDTSLSVPKTSTLRIGGFNTGTGYALNGHVKRVAVYGQSLSSTELAAVTS